VCALVLLILLGFPWWAVDLFSSRVSLVNTLLPDPPQPSVKLKNLARVQCYLHRCRPSHRHCKFKPPHMQAKHSNLDVLGGWASLPTIMPHVPSLLECLVQPPSLAPIFVIYNMTCWYTLVNNFLLTHDPSQLVGFTQFFAQPSSTDNVVTVPLNRALVSSIEHPYCLSSKAVFSSVIIDSGASVCISPHRSNFVTYSTSKMKIKGLSSSNQVAGEGILR
jgi:hypothetical protein